MNRDLDTYLFFDIEVYSIYDAFVVFKDINKKVIKVYRNNFEGLRQFIRGKTLVGFNNYYYDDKILTYMIDEKSVFQIKDLNDRIIEGSPCKLKPPVFRSLDVFQQIDASNPSLKKIEGNFGRMILESSVSFSIETPLTDDQYNEVLNYCMYDVDTTIDIFKIRWNSYFLPKFSLVEMLGKENAIRWNTTTLSGNLLLEKKLNRWYEHRVPEEMMNLVNEDVRNLWNGTIEVGSKKSVTIEEFDCEIQFGLGGLHGAHKRIKNAKKIKLLDVRSMYPSIIILLNALGPVATAKYKEILERRIAVKHKDEILSDALKLILNSVFGCLNNEYSILYNPKACLTVCIYGQIALYELCKRISQFATIVNINTDGVAFIPKDDSYIAAYKMWEEEFQLTLEEKEFLEFYQKDVNNYIAVTKDKMICKGGDVNRYEKDAVFKNNNARILDIALVDHLVHGVDIIHTLKSNLDKPHLYQYILKAGNTYKSSCCQDGKEYNKVNRVFASKQEGFCLFKRRNDDGLVRFADAPTNMFLFNQDCSELTNFKKIIDIDHYYKLVLKRLERWN